MTLARSRELFHHHFGRFPLVVTSAPGRVNLIGEHIDYSGGTVLPIAIDQRTYVALSPSPSPRSVVVSDLRGRAAFDVRAAGRNSRWTDYVHGALREAASLGADLGQVDVALVSGVPSGAGLSSSAALEVAVVRAALAAAGVTPPDDRVARAAFRAETSFVGVPCGIMDQFACALSREGHALALDCRGGESTYVPFTKSVLIVDSTVPRALRHSQYAQRREECDRALSGIKSVAPELTDLARVPRDVLARGALDEVALRRARHAISEQSRVDAACERLRSGDPLGDLLFASHQSLRDDYECSCPELDWIVDWSRDRAEVEGARLTGAGWGGCAILVAPADALDGLESVLTSAFLARFGRKTRTWRTHAAAGMAVEVGP